jgi:hypothetical protein
VNVADYSRRRQGTPRKHEVKRGAGRVRPASETMRGHQTGWAVFDLFGVGNRASGMSRLLEQTRKFGWSLAPRGRERRVAILIHRIGTGTGSE